MNITTKIGLIAPLITAFLTACPTTSEQSTFKVTAPPNNTLEQGNSIILEVKVESGPGFNSPVSLKLENAPVGITGVFNANTVQPGSSSSLRITANIGATLGNAELTLVGEASGATSSSKVNVNVTLPKNYVQLAAPNPTNPAKIVQLPVVLKDGIGTYQGDILFPAARVIGQNSTMGAKGTVMQSGYCIGTLNVVLGKLCTDRAHLWPNKTVPYVFDSSATPAIRALITQAAGIYKDRAEILLVPRGNQDDYLVVRGISDDNIGGSSGVGRAEGAQDFNLNTSDTTIGTVLHELGHALGLWHEQSRPDRDQYVTVLPQNIIEKYRYNYAIKDDPDVARAAGPYDFGSIMHYPLINSLSIDNKPTMEVKNPAGVDLPNIGQRVTLSPGDILALAGLYNAPVTDGSISLRMGGTRELIAGGTRDLSIDVVNDGPRPMQDLYFTLRMPSTFTVNATGSGLQCGSPANNAVVCYTPGGIISGGRKKYGPITVNVPESQSTGFINLDLKLEPIGTRLADPKKSISSIKLCNIKPPLDAKESDSFARPLSTLTQAESPAAGTSQVFDCDGKSLNRYSLHTKADVDYFTLDAPDASPQKRYFPSIDGGPDYEIFDTNGGVVPNGEIVNPGKYTVKVFSSQGRLYTISKDYYNPELFKARDLLNKRLLQKLDAKGPIIRRLLGETAGYVVNNLGAKVSNLTLQGENLTLRLFDTNNVLVLETKSNANNSVALELPRSKIPEAFRVEIARQSNEQIQDGVTVEQPEQQYVIETFATPLAAAGVR
jgi:Astacin (Peptidase family M12A)